MTRKNDTPKIKRRVIVRKHHSPTIKFVLLIITITLLVLVLVWFVLLPKKSIIDVIDMRCAVNDDCKVSPQLGPCEAAVCMNVNVKNSVIQHIQDENYKGRPGVACFVVNPEGCKCVNKKCQELNPFNPDAPTDCDILKGSYCYCQAAMKFNDSRICNHIIDENLRQYCVNISSNITIPLSNQERWNLATKCGDVLRHT